MEKLTAYRMKGDVFSAKGYTSEAQHNYMSALDIGRQIDNGSEETLKLANLYRSIGLNYHRDGETARALASLRQALEIQRKLLPDHHCELGKTYELMGRVYEDRRNGEEKALNCYLKANEKYRDSMTTNHPDVGNNQKNVQRSKFSMRNDRV
jgi:tetratricopeptide (TPR) repeat protein